MGRSFLQRSRGAVLIAALGPFVVLAATPAAAQGLVPACSTYTDPVTGQVIEGFCRFCDLFVLIHNVFQFLALRVAPAVAVVVFLAGALFVMFSGGNEGLKEKGKKVIGGTAVGVVIVLVSWVIVNTTINVLAGFGVEHDPAGQPGGFPWPWNAPRCQSLLTQQCYANCIAGGSPCECSAVCQHPGPCWPPPTP